jgi:hypothetical protein
MQSVQSMHATQAMQCRHRKQAMVATQAWMPEPRIVSTLQATPTLPAVATLATTATLPAVAALPATATLPAVETLPATATLPAVAALPAIATLPAVAVLPTTAVLPNAPAAPPLSCRAFNRFFTPEVSRTATPLETVSAAGGADQPCLRRLRATCRLLRRLMVPPGTGLLPPLRRL